jgi:hypothetical protein
MQKPCTALHCQLALHPKLTHSCAHGLRMHKQGNQHIPSVPAAAPTSCVLTRQERRQPLEACPPCSE